MNFTPLGKRVLVERDASEETTKTGIFIPDSSRETTQKGTVVAVSDEIDNLKAGDRVEFGKYAGSEMTLDGEKFLIMDINDVLGKLK